MAKIAILGFGTVGSGVYEVLNRNAASVARRAGEPVEVKYILDVRDFSDRPDAHLFVKNIDVILADPEVRVVVETIGGTRFAYPYVRQALESGRSVCTSNKEMVATYGAELLALAKSHDCAFLFEASVGGGTPIITPMHQCLAANVITGVEGIVNGTTNFMLTKMARENMGFAEALKIAQQLGYAETKDPGDDVDGRDACRKIAILASLVCGHHIYPQNIPTRGIRDITVADVQAAGRLGCVIKLIAWMKLLPGGGVAAGVEPCLVPPRKPAGRRGRCVQRRQGQGGYAGRRGLLRQGRGQAAHRQRRGGRRGGRPETRGADARQPVLAAGRAGRGDAHRPRPRRHIMCVWRGRPLPWWRPSAAPASWWPSTTTAAPT